MMDKVKILILMYIIVGILLATGGFLLAYRSNFNPYTEDFIFRLVGIIGGAVLLFIGTHIAMVGIISLLSLRRGIR